MYDRAGVLGRRDKGVERAGRSWSRGDSHAGRRGLGRREDDGPGRLSLSPAGEELSEAVDRTSGEISLRDLFEAEWSGDAVGCVSEHAVQVDEFLGGSDVGTYDEHMCLPL